MNFEGKLLINTRANYCQLFIRIIKTALLYSPKKETKCHMVLKHRNSASHFKYHY